MLKTWILCGLVLGALALLLPDELPIPSDLDEVSFETSADVRSVMKLMTLGYGGHFVASSALGAVVALATRFMTVHTRMRSAAGAFDLGRRPIEQAAYSDRAVRRVADGHMGAIGFRLRAAEQARWRREPRGNSVGGQGSGMFSPISDHQPHALARRSNQRKRDHLSFLQIEVHPHGRRLHREARGGDGNEPHRRVAAAG